MQRKGPSGVPFVEVWRGELVESVHAVAACAVDVDGNATIALGDVDVPVYLRSAAKPF
ncbi:MAG: asparaginase, partial [Vulcanimicrobiaceae bacterium]